MSFVGDLFGGDSADASTEAAETQAQYQREALEYLREVETIPRQYREAALTQLGRVFGLSGTQAERDAAMQNLRGSPIYEAIMSGKGAGEEAILRQAGATGGLRSGNVNDALARYSGDLEGRALMESMGGLQGMAAIPSNANQIAQLTTGIGNTYAQGIIGAAQAQQAGIGQGIGTGLGIANLIWSDRRLKENITHIDYRGGHRWYEWDWNEAAADLGLFGRGEGVIADEVELYRPDVVTVKNGYKQVNYEALGV